MKKTSKESWVKEFDEKWEQIYTYDRDIISGHNPYLPCTNRVKQFIRNLLEKHTISLKTEIKVLDEEIGKLKRR